MSHSSDIGLFAFAAGVDVGVDVERCREDVDVLDLAERFFSPAEADDVRRASPGERVAVFYTCWTRKEACLKAIGDGLRVALDSFTAGSAEVRQTVRMVVLDLKAVHDLELYPLPAVPGYRAALATCGSTEFILTCRRWEREA